MPVRKVRPAAPPPEEPPIETDDKIYTATVGDFKIRLRPINPSQWTILTKVTRAAQRSGGEANARAVEVFFGIFERLLVDEEDMQRLEDGLVDGTVTVEALAGAIKGEQDGSAKPTATRTRRGQ